MSAHHAELAELHNAIMAVCEVDQPLSVRGVFYRVMSAGAAQKSEKAYNAVQREVLKLRRAGRLPYEWIADGTRWHIKQPSWDTVEDPLFDAALSYRRALWHDQDVYVEVWSEKEAISSIVAPITEAWDVPLMIARGFASESFLWSTATTMRRHGKDAVVYQLGDHDPSGLAAWNQTTCKPSCASLHRMSTSISSGWPSPKRKISEYNLPTRPTKTTDSQARNFSGESVEVDVIPISILRPIVEDAIAFWIDNTALAATRMVEESERQGLLAMAKRVVIVTATTTSLAIPVITQDMPTLQAGLAYAASGWYVGPVRRGTKRSREHPWETVAAADQPRPRDHRGVVRGYGSRDLLACRPFRRLGCRR